MIWGNTKPMRHGTKHPNFFRRSTSSDHQGSSRYDMMLSWIRPRFTGSIRLLDFSQKRFVNRYQPVRKPEWNQNPSTTSHYAPLRSTGQQFEPLLSHSRRIKYARFSAAIGIASIAALGIFWFTNLEEVPVTGRKHFLWPWKSREDYVEMQPQHNIKAAVDVQILRVAHKRAEIMWPADHPSTMAIQTVFDRVLRAHGYSPGDWKLHIANSPGK